MASTETGRTAPGVTRSRSATHQRRAEILRVLNEQPITTAALALEFGITETSVRRELAAMEREGSIIRVRGGAVRRTQSWSSLYAAAASRHPNVKTTIAAVAAALIPPGSNVLCYSGTTVARTVELIDPALRPQLTVATNNLAIVQEVGGWDDPHLVVIGGTFLPAYLALVGPQAMATLDGLHADIAVMGCDGLSAEAGLTTPHQLVAEIGTKMIQRAKTVIVVADSSKIGRFGFTPIAPITAIHTVVTDAGASADEIGRIEATGVRVIIAGD